MSDDYFEEGDQCPTEGCDGILELEEHKGCSCHINPPCSNCTDRILLCPKCDWEGEKPDLNYSGNYTPDDSIWKPRELDKSKIDYRIKSHSYCSQICEGVYPEGTTQDEVEGKVKGTFGGRFEQFGNGRFKYIAYTD